MAEIGGVPKSGLEANTKANLYLISDIKPQKVTERRYKLFSLIRLH